MYRGALCGCGPDPPRSGLISGFIETGALAELCGGPPGAVFDVVFAVVVFLLAKAAQENVFGGSTVRQIKADHSSWSPLSNLPWLPLYMSIFFSYFKGGKLLS